MSGISGGTLSRVVPAHRLVIKFNWCHREFMNFGVFREARVNMRNGLGGYDKCYWCKRPFADADMMALAQPEKGKNRALCQDCAALLLPPESMPI